jgi:hypothetical protein
MGVQCLDTITSRGLKKKGQMDRKVEEVAAAMIAVAKDRKMGEQKD